jgi:hypothetical protein
MGRRVVKGHVVALEYWRMRSGASSVECMVFRPTEVEFGRQMVVLG